VKTNQIENDRLYKERNADRGLVKVTLWVPEDKREAIKDLAAKWREGGK
jgi:hypothetical protein